LSNSRDKLIDEIFGLILEADADNREKLLAERCGDDSELLAEVKALLDASAQGDDFLSDTIDHARKNLFRTMLSGDEKAVENLSGQTIGNWRLVSKIARGGLATVYKAERADDAYDQVVAFKVMRRGLDTDDLIARFRAERQILSSLEHPAIAQILDGGALDDGRPYLVLEYVNGDSITGYCEANSVNERGRLVLLTGVLRALHHAHRYLVVHRDVKPSNILVSKDGHVTLLDFGIAKLLDPAAMPGASTLTRTGVSLLTPGYGSPEQHAGEAVTTASDIYQVGRVMSDLMGPQSGDLGAIMAKAMHAEPTHRYASANEMLEDIKRYLDGLPVIARPDTWSYRLRKFVTRRPWLAPTLALAAIGVAAYITTLTIYSQQLAKEEALAAASQQFMVDLFRSADPFAPADAERGQAITVVEALRIGRDRIGNELAGQPELRASLLGTISDVYTSLDLPDEALQLRQDALELERELYGESSPQVVSSMRALGSLLDVGEEQARKMLEQQLAMARAAYSAGDAEIGLSEIALGLYLNQVGDVEKSKDMLLGGVDKLDPTNSDHARRMITALLVSAEYYGMESPEEALSAVNRASEIANLAFGEDSLQAALVQVRLASTMTTYGDFENSEKNFRASIPALEAKLGENHSSTLSALNNLGYLYSFKGDQVKAEEIHRDLLQRNIAKHGPVHRAVADSYQNLAAAVHDQGRLQEAIPLHRSAYDIYKEIFNDQHYMIAFPLMSMAKVEINLGEGVAAEITSREALERLRATAPGTFLEGVALCLLGLSLEQQGQIDEGSALVESAHSLMDTGNIPNPYPALCRLPGAVGGG
jgi:serine/threonine-protein kinase